MTRLIRWIATVAAALAVVTTMPGAGSVASAAVNGNGAPPGYATFTLDCGRGPMLVAVIGYGRWDAFLVVGTNRVFVPFTKDFTIVTPDGTFAEVDSRGPVPPGAVTCTRDNWWGDVHLFGTQVGLLT